MKVVTLGINIEPQTHNTKRKNLITDGNTLQTDQYFFFAEKQISIISISQK
jgi:hypothetical protein